MRRTRWLNGMLKWLCLALCCTLLAPDAQAAQTTLSVNFQGMWADATGAWQMERLSGEFEVLAGTEVLGVVAANGGEAGLLPLPKAEQISLHPVMDTMPEGYLIADAPISVSITAGKRNDPPVLVYADAGLFTVQGEIGAAFALLDEAGAEVLRFTLDDGSGTDRQILSGIHKWYEPEDLVGKTLVAILNLPPRKMMGLESNGMLISAVHTEDGEEVLHLLMVDDAIPAGAKMC